MELDKCPKCGSKLFSLNTYDFHSYGEIISPLPDRLKAGCTYDLWGCNQKLWYNPYTGEMEERK